MRDRLEDAIKRARAEYIEIRFEEVESVSVSFRGREIDSISSSKVRGGIVRALMKGGWGMAVFNDPDRIDGFKKPIAHAGDERQFRC